MLRGARATVKIALRDVANSQLTDDFANRALNDTSAGDLETSRSAWSPPYPFNVSFNVFQEAP